jgi:hypothetical protein
MSKTNENNNKKERKRKKLTRGNLGQETTSK